MKKKYSYNFILIIILVIVLGFQKFRVENIEDYFSLKQSYNYELYQLENGNLEIKNPQKYLVFYDERSEVSRKILERWKSTMDFSKVKYDLLSIDSQSKINFNNYIGVVFTNEDFTGFQKLNYIEIENKVENGMSLFFLTRSYSNPFSKIIGIEKINNFTEAKGLKFTKDIFPGFKDIVVEGEIIENSSLDLKLSQETKVIAISKKNIPIIWEKMYGKGKVIYINGSMFESKLAEGVLKQLVAYGSEITVLPVLNSKLVHFDDLPAPIFDKHHEPIFVEYRMGTKDFFDNIWWKDMEGIALRNNLKYTTFAIMRYNDAVSKEEIKEVSKRNFESLSRQGRNIIKQGGEIGIHGYNHFSLGLIDEMDYNEYNYAPWKSIEDMKIGLSYFRKVFHEMYGEQVNKYAYVAPSNLLSKSGKKALVETFPNLKSLSGIFYAEEEEPGLLVQDVGKDPDYPNLYSLPRFSSGLFKEDKGMWSIYNSIASYGYVSHFLHPDDITDEERGKNKLWSTLKEEFESIFIAINKNFPLLKPSTQSELNYDYSKLENIQLDYELEKNNLLINIKNFCGPIQSYVRLNKKKILQIDGANYRLMQKTDDYHLYLVDLENKEIKIKVGDA